MRPFDARRRFGNVIDVAKWRLCVGCGACAFACGEKKIGLVDFPDQGIRPVLRGDSCSNCSSCLDACPGIGVSHPASLESGTVIKSLSRSWGPVLEVWEGSAADADLRFNGSSGGLASALALYGIERAGMQGVVHVGIDEEARYKNKTVFSRTRKEILAATGSKYSPASPCDGLGAIAEAGGPCVFIGKPCDVEGARKVAALNRDLAEKLGLTIGIFCAGTPSTKGTLDLLEKLEVQPDALGEIRYRGRGWPGGLAVRYRNESNWRELATYAEAWGYLQRYRPYRCHVCPDSTSEFADISCGDPWYRDVGDGEAGLSLVLVRTERGRAIVEGAIQAGYVHLSPANPEALVLSQKEVFQKRGAVWGRITTLRAFGIPAPNFAGFFLFHNWLKLPLMKKIRSITGTVKRVITRRYYIRHG